MIVDSLFAQFTNQTYPVVIAQYKRDDYGVGAEERLHWAMWVFTKKETLAGHCFQAVDRIYPDGRQEWRVSYAANASITKVVKCLGGVEIGAVKKGDLDKFLQLAKDHAASPTSDEWNCRSYVSELVEILGELMSLRISRPLSVEELLPDLREASRITHDQSTKAHQYLPCIKFYP